MSNVKVTAKQKKDDLLAPDQLSALRDFFNFKAPLASPMVIAILLHKGLVKLVDGEQFYYGVSFIVTTKGLLKLSNEAPELWQNSHMKTD